MTYFEEALYSEHSIPDILIKYEKLLKSTGSSEDALHAAKIEEYRKMLVEKCYLSNLRKVFNNFFKILSDEFPHIRFRIAGRRKSLISFEKKIRKNLNSNKSLDLIRDILGVRIILLNGTEKDCYTILERFIEYCVQQGFTICEETSHNSAKDSLEKISPLLGQFYYGIIDYIAEPKPNGYQSLHAIFRTPTASFFEVQVRTFEMHVNAASGSSNHEDYKKQKYSESNLVFDRSKINVPGYYYDSSETIDLVGLEHSLEIIQRNKSF